MAVCAPKKFAGRHQLQRLTQHSLLTGPTQHWKRQAKIKEDVAVG